MCSADVTQSAMFSFRTLEQRIPASHPLRKLRVLVDGILALLHWEFEKLYAKTERPSIPPERLLRASLIQTLYSIRSERQLMPHIDFNLLYRWFVGLDMDDPVWEHSRFSSAIPGVSASCSPPTIRCATSTSWLPTPWLRHSHASVRPRDVEHLRLGEVRFQFAALLNIWARHISTPGRPHSPSIKV